MKRGESAFEYFYKGKKVNDTKILSRIADLHIPPGYHNVRINPDKGARIQWMAQDDRGRSQYRYSEETRRDAIEEKYKRMIQFGKVLPSIRTQLKQMIRNPEYEELATALMLLDFTKLRVGNEKYQEENGTFGITTLEKQHIIRRKTFTELRFVGKKGVENVGRVNNRQVMRVLDRLSCKRKKDDRIFGTINNDDVNAWIKQFGPFTARDFRTWGANTLFIKNARCYLQEASSPAEVKRAIHDAVYDVADVLSNTKTVCQGHYVDQRLMKWAIDNYDKLRKMRPSSNGQLSSNECLLIKVWKHIINSS